MKKIILSLLLPAMLFGATENLTLDTKTHVVTSPVWMTTGVDTIYFIDSGGILSPVTIGANMTFVGGTLDSTAAGGGTWGTITGTLSDQLDLQAALDAKVPTSRTVGLTAPLTGGGALSSNLTLAIPAATGSQNGYLTSADWTTFNAKQSAITPAALTKSDDTNVTLSLGGTPATALLQATSLTLGWSGTLAVSRGGTGAATSAAHKFFGNNTGSTGAPDFVSIGSGDLPDLSSTYVPTSRSLTIGPTTSDLSADRTFLGNVTDDAQTKSAIVPNTVPSSAQLLVGNAGGTAYAPQTLSGSGATATLSSSGVLTLSSIANASLANSSITIGGSSTALGGSVLGNVTNDTQTKSAVVPNTAPSSGQILVGNAGGTAYAPQTLSGSGATATLSSAGVLTLSNVTGANTLNTSRNLWGQSFNGSADVTGSLTSVGDITGGASNMAITAGTGNSRTLTLKTTTSGGTATNGLVIDASQHITLEGVTSTGATGTGKFVFDNAPTITGHPVVEGVTSTGATGTGKFVFDTAPTTSNEVVGTQSADDNSTKAASTAYVDGRLPKDVALAGYQALGSVLLGETLGASLAHVGQGGTSQLNLASGTVYFVAVYIPKAATITGIKFLQSTQGVFTANTSNVAGLYSYSGGTLTLQASSSDDANLWKASSNSMSSKAFQATYAAAAGLYFVGILYHQSAQTTAPGLLGFAGTGQAYNFTLDFTNSAKVFGTLGSQTALPSPTQAMSGISTSTGTMPWLGVY